MRTTLIPYLFVGTLFFVTITTFSQTYDALLSVTPLGKDITEQLPPLAELQAKAIQNSPLFKILDTDVTIGEYRVKEEQREWMNSLGFEGGARYGLFDNLIITQDLDMIESNPQKTEQTRYYFGAFVKIPLSAVFDNSNVRAAKAEKDKLRYQREARIQELRQLIIVRYNEVIKQSRGLVIKTNAVENYRVQMIRAEIDLKNNQISFADYARLSDMLTKAVIEQEEAKLDFATAFQILEETVGTKINFKK